jgi:hypothetical protein
LARHVTKGSGHIRRVSDRLVLREFAAFDEEAVHAYAGDRLVTRFMDWGPNRVEDTRTFLSEAIAKAADPVRQVSKFRRRRQPAVVNSGAGPVELMPANESEGSCVAPFGDKSPRHCQTTV